MNIISKNHRYFRLAALFFTACYSLTLSAKETSVLSDNFSKASVEEATASIRSETSWYGFTKGGGKLPTAKETDLSGDTVSVLEFSAQSQQTLIVAAFPAVDLKRPGDYLQLSVEYRYLYLLKGMSPAFVVGLYDSGGAPLVTGDLRKDLDQAGAAGSNHVGFRLAKLPTDMTGDLQLDQVTGLGGLFPQTKIDTASSGLTLGPREMHQMTLRITLGENGNLVFNYGVDGVFQKYSTTAPLKVAITRFNEISICPLGRGFERGGSNFYIQLGKVKVVRGER
ncbi:MAG: hypothetical protein WC205_03780 [Opitutaceae bacterium]|jgi:hypothetical protein